MLTILTRKLCPLMSLAIASVGCGKKINEPKSELSRQTEGQKVPSAYVMRLDGSKASTSLYAIPGDATFLIPDKLIVRSGSTTSKEVEVSYNIDEFDTEIYDYKCIYIATSNPSYMKLEKCIDYNGSDFGDVSEARFSLEKHQLIQMKFTGARASDLVVESIHTMNWF